MVRAALLDKNEVQTLVKNFLDNFQDCINQQKNPTQWGFDKFLGEKFHITSNGESVAKTLPEYLNRLALFQKKFTHCEIRLWIEDSVYSDNHFACHYKVNLTERGGHKIVLCMMAIGACDHDKIISWKQVVNEEGKSHL